MSSLNFTRACKTIDMLRSMGFEVDLDDCTILPRSRDSFYVVASMDGLAIDIRFSNHKQKQGGGWIRTNTPCPATGDDGYKAGASDIDVYTGSGITAKKLPKIITDTYTKIKRESDNEQFKL